MLRRCLGTIRAVQGHQCYDLVAVDQSLERGAHAFGATLIVVGQEAHRASARTARGVEALKLGIHGAQAHTAFALQVSKGADHDVIRVTRHGGRLKLLPIVPMTTRPQEACQ